MLSRSRSLIMSSLQPLDDLRRRFTDACGHYRVPATTTTTWWGTILDRYSEPQRHYHNVQHLTELFSHADRVQGEYDKVLAAYRHGPHQGSIDRPSTVLAGEATPFLSAHSLALTIFFHDIVYDPTAHSGDNEEKSALLFQEFCSSVDEGAGGGGALREVEPQVTSIIRATKNHMNYPRTATMAAATLPSMEDVAAGRVVADVWRPSRELDCALFLDMDIAILGSNTSRYQEYADQIRKEHIHFPDEAFRKGRRQVLLSFANHAGINPLAAGEVKEAAYEDCSLYKTPLFHQRFVAQARRNIKWELAMLELPMFQSRTITIAGQQEANDFQKKHHNDGDLNCPFSMRLLEVDVEYMLAFAFEFCLCLRVGSDEASAEQRQRIGAVGTMAAACFLTQTNREGFVGPDGSPTSFDPQRRDHEHGGRYALLHAIVVHTAARNQGIGSKVLRELIMKLRASPSTDHPIERIYVCVPRPDRSNSSDGGDASPKSALRFYQKNGFTVTREFTTPKEREQLVELSLAI